MANSFNSSSLFTVPRPIVKKDAVNYDNLTGDITMDYMSSTYQFLKQSGGSHTITLPALKNGISYWFKSRASSTGTISIKDAAAATVETLTAGQSCHIVCDGSFWLVAIKS
tara:strand:+ start:572 stop:904 length:333 start_codon:yes stop_codon:yes gene_type:complete